VSDQIPPDIDATFELACWRCRGRFPDALDNPRGLERLLHRTPMVVNGPAVRLPAPVMMETINQGDVQAAGRPVHRSCRPGYKPPPRRQQRLAPYDLGNSVR